jgi:hypothetical protein
VWGTIRRVDPQMRDARITVDGGLAGERASEREGEEARAQDLPIPHRSTMVEVYSAPPEGAEVYDINRGE